MFTNKQKILKNDFFVKAVIVIVVFIGLHISLNKNVDSDEMESLAAASFITDGKIPYKDFWQIHPPLFYYFLSPLFFFFKSMDILYAARTISFVLWLLNAFFLFLIAKRLFSYKAALFTVLAYLISMPVLSAMLEVRPDILVASFCNLSLIFLLMEGHQPLKNFFLAGILSGFAIISKQSGLIFVSAVFIFYMIRCLSGNARFWDQGLFSEKRFNIKSMFSFLAGVLLPCLILGISLYSSNALVPFLKYSIKNDFGTTFSSLKHIRGHWYPYNSLKEILMVNFAFFLLSGALSLFLIFNNKKLPLHTLNGFLFIFYCMIAYIIALFFILHPWLQEFILFSQCLAILTGLSLAFIDEYSPHYLIKISVFLLLCLPSLVGFYKLNSFDLPKTCKKFDNILSVTNKNDKCLSICPCPFRPSVYFYRLVALLTNTPEKRTQIENALMNNINNDKVIVIIYSPFYTELPKFLNLVKNNYVMYRNMFYIPGQLIKHGVGKMNLNILVDGIYDLKYLNGSTIDGKNIDGEKTYLEKGHHDLVVNNPKINHWLIYDLIANKRRAS